MTDAEVNPTKRNMIGQISNKIVSRDQSAAADTTARRSVAHLLGRSLFLGGVFAPPCLQSINFYVYSSEIEIFGRQHPF